jgi:hypothetical protein
MKAKLLVRMFAALFALTGFIVYQVRTERESIGIHQMVYNWAAEKVGADTTTHRLRTPPPTTTTTAGGLATEHSKPMSGDMQADHKSSQAIKPHDTAPPTEELHMTGTSTEPTSGDTHTHIETKYDDTDNLDARFQGKLASNPFTLHEHIFDEEHQSKQSLTVLNYGYDKGFLENDRVFMSNKFLEVCNGDYERIEKNHDNKKPTVAMGQQLCDDDNSVLVEPFTGRQYRVQVNPTRSIASKGTKKATLMGTAKPEDKSTSTDDVAVVVKVILSAYSLGWARAREKEEKIQWKTLLDIDPAGIYHCPPWGSCDATELTGS